MGFINEYLKDSEKVVITDDNTIKICFNYIDIYYVLCLYDTLWIYDLSLAFYEIIKQKTNMRYSEVENYIIDDFNRYNLDVTLKTY